MTKIDKKNQRFEVWYLFLNLNFRILQSRSDTANHNLNFKLKRIEGNKNNFHFDFFLRLPNGSMEFNWKYFLYEEHKVFFNELVTIKNTFFEKKWNQPWLLENTFF